MSSLFRKCIVRHLMLAAAAALTMTIVLVLLSLFLFTHLVYMWKLKAGSR